MGHFTEQLKEACALSLKASIEEWSKNKEQEESIVFSDSFKQQMNALFSSYGMKPPHPEVEKE